jgi:hypothetical protein
MRTGERRIERWEAQGLVRRASADLSEFDRIGEVRTDSTVEEILADLTGES